MRSTIKKGPRTVGLKRADTKEFKARLQSMWDALNKSAANTPEYLESVLPSGGKA